MSEQQAVIRGYSNRLLADVLWCMGIVTGSVPQLRDVANGISADLKAEILARISTPPASSSDEGSD